MQNKQAKAAPDAGFTHILISGMLQKSFLCLKKNLKIPRFWSNNGPSWWRCRFVWCYDLATWMKSCCYKARANFNLTRALIGWLYGNEGLAKSKGAFIMRSITELSVGHKMERSVLVWSVRNIKKNHLWKWSTLTGQTGATESSPGKPTTIDAWMKMFLMFYLGTLGLHRLNIKLNSKIVCNPTYLLELHVLLSLSPVALKKA